jgi:hypothetical protein
MSVMMPWRCAFGCLLVAAGCVIDVNPSFAQEPSQESAERNGRMSYDGSYVMLGPSLTLTLDRDEGDGGALGGEASFVGVRDALWAGAYLDAVHAFAADETRLSIGPEVGVRLLGVDAGYVLNLGARSAQHGLAVRPMLTLGVVTVYFRSTWLAGERADWLGELGVLLKAPILLGNEPWF